VEVLVAEPLLDAQPLERLRSSAAPGSRRPNGPVERGRTVLLATARR